MGETKSCQASKFSLKDWAGTAKKTNSFLSRATCAEVASDVANALATNYFRAFWTTDVIGTELAGAVKNIVAIANGIAVGLGLGENTQSALITRGLAEMTRLGVALGAKTETFLGLAGIGDLIATSSSAQAIVVAVGWR